MTAKEKLAHKKLGAGISLAEACETKAASGGFCDRGLTRALENFQQKIFVLRQRCAKTSF
jgi:hypothetical protein